MHWSVSDGTLLQLADRHQIKVKKSCCKGNCGACVAQLLSGQVYYQEEMSFKVTGNEILLCSAYPGLKSTKSPPYLRLNL
ncbi:MAG: 2Fe-2S iron-sulfur cluster binding domain-containing protein [Psychromonas sp.]|nr:2Fe-2S iron-sulfur cluster binding domain-containing protein [Psychromonas sp.]